MYARGMTVREIQGFLAEMYAVDVSPDLISSVTDAVMSEVTAWQARPLEAMYPVVFFDALRVKIRQDGVVRNKAVYLALGMLAGYPLRGLLSGFNMTTGNLSRACLAWAATRAWCRSLHRCSPATVVG